MAIKKLIFDFTGTIYYVEADSYEAAMEPYESIARMEWDADSYEDAQEFCLSTLLPLWQKTFLERGIKIWSKIVERMSAGEEGALALGESKVEDELTHSLPMKSECAFCSISQLKKPRGYSANSLILSTGHACLVCPLTTCMSSDCLYERVIRDDIEAARQILAKHKEYR